MDTIPSLDLRHFTEGTAEQRAAFVHTLGQGFQQFGFVALSHHGLDDELQAELYRQAEAFFTLPDADKMACHSQTLHGQRGYTPKRQEHAKGQTVGDLKEFYHVGQPDPTAQGDDYPPNLWPEQLPAFRQAMEQAFLALEAAGLELLKAVALYLELPQDYFYPKVVHGNSILRPIHYFPIDQPEELEEGAVRAAAHGDINLITLLMGASADGLEIQKRDGSWLSVTALPGQVVVNVGDMLARHTNDLLPSTIHRVVNPPAEKLRTSRYSIPFFMHPRSEMDLSVLPSCVSDSRPKAYEDTTAGEFLDQRLREIGLKS